MRCTWSQDRCDGNKNCDNNSDEENCTPEGENAARFPPNYSIVDNNDFILFLNCRL